MKKFYRVTLALFLILTSLFFADFVYSEESPEKSKEKLLVNDLNFNKDTGIVSYELAMPAWVRIRLGLQEGPMCKTLIDWEERSAGRHEEKWDGLDPSGTVNLLGDKLLVFTFNYFTAGDEYINLATIDDFVMPPGQAIIGRSLPTLKINQIHKKHPRQFCHDPKINVILPEKILKAKNGAYVIKDKVPVEISIADADKDWFRQERYSVHIFIDGIFACGELEGYSPYDWIFDPKNLNEGEHLIMVNLSGFNDHIGIAALPVYIKKKGN